MMKIYEVKDYLISVSVFSGTAVPTEDRRLQTNFEQYIEQNHGTNWCEADQLAIFTAQLG